MSFLDTAKQNAKKIAVQPEIIKLNKSCVYNPTTYEHLCWIFVNGILRADTLKKFDFTKQTFFNSLLTEIPLCAICNMPLKWIGNTYHQLGEQTCSKKCYAQTPAGKLKYEKVAQQITQNRLKTIQECGDNAWSLSAREKRENTKLKKYGHKTGFSLETDVKRKATLFEKFGTTNSFTTPVSLQNRLAQKQREKAGSLKTMLSLNAVFSNLIWDGHGVPSQWSCKRCAEDFWVESTNPSVAIRCPKCDPVVGSLIQKRLADELKKILKTEILYNTRKILYPREIDIFLPEYQIGIEINGLYWHSSNVKETPLEKKKAQNKWKDCNAKGIKLLTFFEDELYDFDLAISMILSKCGIFNRRIGARKLILKIISRKDADNFLSKNHLRKSANAKLYVGLFQDEELLQVATFGKSRFEKNKIELIRFATKLHTQVIGGFSRFLKFAKNYFAVTEIISYADCCYSDGDTYRQFASAETLTPPGYFWWKQNTPFKCSRQKFQKHKLKAFDNYSADKTEAQIMFEAGYRRLWDCGSLKFIL
ncbi:MAG: hypothetical protein QXN55_01355 [Candidatus Nitrosotenuis sp.]